MSEYQYYEFLALDRPLDDRQQAEVRSLSTRASITATSFINEYHWGNFRGDPNRMMERYYDAHLYLTNWGTHRIMLRLPRELLDIDVVEDHCVGDQVTVWTTGEFLVLDMTSEDDSGDWEYDPQGKLSAIVGARTELATGDLRPLYLAWLAGYGAWERDEDTFDRDEDHELEPPVPPGLTTLTAAQQALVDFLRLDDDLLAIAAQTSPPLDEIADDSGQLAAWVTNLPHAEKNRLLLRVVEDHAVTVRMEILRRFRDEHAPNIPDPSRRTVADLLDGAAQRRADRQRREAAQRADEQVRHENTRALAREQRLDELARTEDAAWSRVEEMIATRKRAEYDAVITLLTDLQALAERDGRPHTFTQRSMALRQMHTRNSFKYASKKDWAAIARDLKPVYTAVSESAALDAFAEFSEKWEKKYPAIIRLWTNAWAEFVPFLQFDREIRTIICTTNAIESINARIRRAVNARGHFPTEAAALKCVYLAIMSLDPTGKGQQRWSNRWKAALNAFEITFNGRLSA